MTDSQAWVEERLHYGKKQRMKRWEYWPAYLLYIPIAFYSLFYLAIRYRGLLTFTAANPSIEDGGVINESKVNILDLLKQGDDEAVPNFVFLPMTDSLEQRREKAFAMIDDKLIDFPCVFKPNAGQRGTGVVVVHDKSELEQQLKKMEADHLLQAFCPGREVSVFYYRFPVAEQGHVFSITLKTLPKVIGDGTSNLKTLILKDERHVCMADFLFNLLKDRLEEVPALNEEVILNKVGAHCKGSMFEDGSHLAGEGLRKRLDKMMGCESGLCFGRFDVMIENLEDLKEGKGIKIIELNGVTSEATHIYDPKYSVFNAWKVLARQWKIAYQIGAAHKKLGHKSSSIPKLLKQIIYYRSKVKSYSGVS